MYVCLFGKSLKLIEMRNMIVFIFCYIIITNEKKGEKVGSSMCIVGSLGKGLISLVHSKAVFRVCSAGILV